MQEESKIIDLGPIHEPLPVDFAFETVGWKVLAALIVVILVGTTYFVIRRYLANTYRRKALYRLSAIEKQFQAHHQVDTIVETLILLKKISIKTYSRKSAAALHGAGWLDFLDSKAKRSRLSAYKDVVISALYKNEVSNAQEAEYFLAESRKWIKNHVS